MLKKRVIFTLLYDNGSFMLSRNFRLQRVGDLNWLQKNYNFSRIAFSIDELIILDVTRGKRDQEKFCHHIKSLTKGCFVPIAAGGGIRQIEQAAAYFNNGADKIVLNSLITENPELVKEFVKRYGSQSIVVSIDFKNCSTGIEVFIHNGTTKINMSIYEYIKYIQSLNAGEVYFNSIDRDGTGFGYDLEVIKMLENKMRLPLIIAGGAGNENHLLTGLQLSGVNAVATANLFNFIGNGLPNARKSIINRGGNIANWDSNINQQT